MRNGAASIIRKTQVLLARYVVEASSTVSDGARYVDGAFVLYALQKAKIELRYNQTANMKDHSGFS